MVPDHSQLSEQINSIIGKKGTISEEVIKFTFPRFELRVNIGQVELEPELALTSWTAFHLMGGQSSTFRD